MRAAIASCTRRRASAFWLRTSCCAAIAACEDWASRSPLLNWSLRLDNSSFRFIIWFIIFCWASWDVSPAASLFSTTRSWASSACAFASSASVCAMASEMPMGSAGGDSGADAAGAGMAVGVCATAAPANASRQPIETSIRNRMMILAFLRVSGGREIHPALPRAGPSNPTPAF